MNIINTCCIKFKEHLTAEKKPAGLLLTFSNEFYSLLIIQVLDNEKQFCMFLFVQQRHKRSTSELHQGPGRIVQKLR
jgi:hypothetical protein